MVLCFNSFWLRRKGGVLVLGEAGAIDVVVAADLRFASTFGGCSKSKAKLRASATWELDQIDCVAIELAATEADVW